LGSGNWIRSIKRNEKENLTREILEFCEDSVILMEKELEHIRNHYNDPLNMNMVKQSSGIVAGMKIRSLENPEKDKKRLEYNRYWKNEYEKMKNKLIFVECYDRACNVIQIKVEQYRSQKGSNIQDWEYVRVESKFGKQRLKDLFK
jgi:hypothetical protein